MNLWLNVVAVSGGAAIGACMRWGFGLALNPLWSAVPLGTLAANLIGGFVMGVVLALIHALPEISVTTRLFLTTGLLGGLTTFSSFSGEVFGMLQRQAWGWAAATILLHVAGSILATALGWYSMQAWR